MAMRSGFSNGKSFRFPLPRAAWPALLVLLVGAGLSLGAGRGAESGPAKDEAQPAGAAADRGPADRAHVASPASARARRPRGAPLDAATLAKFPVRVGQVGPIAADNRRQQPFGCQTQETPLGQPQVDNQEGIGLPVTDPGGPAAPDPGAIDPAAVVGYSADCGAPTQVLFWYRSTAGGPLRPLPDPEARPADLAMLDVGGQRVPYIVRHEIGTLNRFIYSLFLLTPEPSTDPAQVDLSVWNGNLVHHFGGGVGVGFSQSNGFARSFVTRPDGRGLNVPLLERGYAIATSTGTVTNTTYNLLLTGQTAAMVKQQFVSAYAAPDHTFGLGGSGGAIQQYVYAQNVPGLLDALLPRETFGDMITEVTGVGDCELLEFYFDQGDARVNGTGAVNPKWTDWENRQEIQGLNAINGAPTDFDQGGGIPLGSSARPGTNECIEAWRGLGPLVVNPRFVRGATYDLIEATQPEVFARTRFSYFEDLKHIFGLDPETGFARTTFDNVGVQYGLEALRQGEISVDEFLLLNAHVGGFKDPSEMVREGFPFDEPLDFSRPDLNIDPWSSRNATAREHLVPGAVAPRVEGDPEAIRAAFRSGLVFFGNIDVPMLVLDNYLEPELDMHHSREKFELRARMLEVDGDASNLVLWAMDREDDEAVVKLTLEGLSLLETWLEDGVAPPAATDACFDADGSEIARGPRVWDGILTPEGEDDGACVADFPIFGSPRTVAGQRLNGVVLKCRTKPVEVALRDGTYGDVTFSEAQEDRLREIFGESGVCDFSKRDRERPSGRAPAALPLHLPF